MEHQCMIPRPIGAPRHWRGKIHGFFPRTTMAQHGRDQCKLRWGSTASRVHRLAVDYVSVQTIQRLRRILFVAQLGAGASAADGNLVYYTDDSGSSWEISPTVIPGGQEAQIVELSNGSLFSTQGWELKGTLQLGIFYQYRRGSHMGRGHCERGLLPQAASAPISSNYGGSTPSSTLSHRWMIADEFGSVQTMVQLSAVAMLHHQIICRICLQLPLANALTIGRARASHRDFCRGLPRTIIRIVFAVFDGALHQLGY